MTIRFEAVHEACVGALLWGLTAVAAHAAPSPPERPAAPSPSERPAAPSPSERPAARTQTLRGSEPPLRVGAAFDGDEALPIHAPDVASYTLRARLDPERHTIDGQGTLVWQNASTRPAAELYFHLYLNAFKNNRTVFLRSPFGGGRSGHGGKKWGYIDVRHLAVRGMDGVVWPKGATTPDDPDDETDIRVPLPREVPPGETITVDFDWTSQLPEVVERTGFVRDFHMVGQWFPKIARREPDGVWVHFPFNAASEFYADFGSYDVTLDVPKGLVVGASGSRVGDETHGDRRVVRYRLDGAHDFAFTAWRRFRDATRSIDGVSVRVLYPPGNEGNAEATFAAVAHGLAFYGRRFGRYPYPTLTVVHPPEWASAAGGMEYPTLITTGAPWYTHLVSSLVERVTLHELGHQWFYGLVATDEHAFPFLDEGLTTYAESAAMTALFGDADGVRAPGLSISGNAYLRASAVEAGHDDIVALPAADFASFHEVGALVYARTGVILETLARVYGRSGLERALGRYARRYRFEHPGPKHLIAVVREVMGDDAADFLHSALLEGGTVDFVAKDLKALPVRPEAGVFDRSGGRTEKNPVEPSRESKWAGRVLVFRHGSLRVPVDVELAFEDGTHTRRRWDGRGRREPIAVESRSPLVAVDVDPDRTVLLDDDLTNGSVRRGRPATSRVVERGIYAAELFLGALGP